MLTYGLNKEYTMYDKLLKCPRPSVTCMKVALTACDFLPEKCTSSICHGKLQEIVKAGTRRFFRSTFQSRPGIINPPITCYYLCFDLVAKSLFLAMINMVYCEYSLLLEYMYIAHVYIWLFCSVKNLFNRSAAHAALLYPLCFSRLMRNEQKDLAEKKAVGS